MTRPRTNTRAMTLARVEIRAAAEGASSAGTIVGYAAVYASESEDLGGFREILAPGAFDAVLAANPDVRMPHLDHQDMPLGRTTAGTLRLFSDAHGLGFEVDVPDTERGRETIIAVERGDVNQCSFRFVVLPEDREWTYPEDGGTPLRTVNRVAELWDVCLVTYPAYTATTAGMRSLDDGPPEDIPAAPADAAGLTDLRRRTLRRERRA